MSDTLMSTCGDISYQLKIKGSEMPTTLEVTSIKVVQKANMVGSATVTLIDGDPSKENFPLSEKADFTPGNSIEILAGYMGKDNGTIYKGMIVKQSQSVDEDLGSTLTVECNDTAIKMCVGVNDQIYADQTDNAIMTAVIANTEGLSSEVASTTASFEQVVQYNTSDWEFLISRAEMNGFVVITEDDTVTVAKISDAESSGFEATYGKNIITIETEMNSLSQYSSITTESWDAKTQEVVSDEAPNSENGPGDISSGDLAKVVGLSTYKIQSPTGLDKDELEEWSEGILAKVLASKICGSIKVQGRSDVALGTTLSLDGMGNGFNGDHYVSGVTHELTDGDWLTTLDIGLPPDSWAETNEHVSPSNSDIQPRVAGIIQGTVMEIVNDANNAFRVKVNAPILGQESEGIWARLTHPYASNNAGFFFMPEKDDEVALGFFNDDPHFPVILGSMYSSDKIKPFKAESGDESLKPDLEPNDENSTKAIVTKSGLRIAFQDTKKIITITTPAENYLIFDDDAGSITIQDQTLNKVVMDDKGISMTSPKDITIKADQKVTITGTQGISVNSDQEIASMAPTIKEVANDQFMVSAGLGLVSASNELTLEGKMVMIN